MSFRGKYFLIHFDRWLLFKLFKFNRWHIQKTKDRPYVNGIINFINSLPQVKNFTVLEIGWGLGDIIGAVNCKKRYYLDNDVNDLRAARLISFLKFNFNSVFNLYQFPDIISMIKFDCIILVNWTHEIQYEILKPGLISLFEENLNKEGLIVIDSAESTNHKFCHNIESIFQEYHPSIT